MSRRWIWILAGGVAVAGTLTAVVVRSGLTQVASVRVVGATSLPPATVRAAAEIAPGDNALTLDLDAATARVEALAMVAGAEVRRDGALGVVIEIRERAPAIVVVEDERRIVVDASGEALTGAAPAGLPRLRVAPDAAVPPNAVRGVLRLVDRMRPREARGASLGWGPVNGITVTALGSTVSFGDGDDLATKLELWRRLRSLHAKAPRRIDLAHLPHVSIVI